MNIETAKLPQLSLDLGAHLEEKLYSVSILNQYRGTYNRFFNYLNENKLPYFSKEMGFSFVDNHYVSEEKSVSRNYRINMRRQISVLFEFYTEGAKSMFVPECRRNNEQYSRHFYK